MPTKPGKGCRAPGCKEIIYTNERYCAKHLREVRKLYFTTSVVHKENIKFYSSPEWRHVRLMHIEGHPYCVECLKMNIRTIGTIVDHRIPRKDDPSLSFDPSNLDTLCTSHHNRKTMNERHKKSKR